MISNIMHVLYRFDYDGLWSYANTFGETAKMHGGIAHLDDVRYLMR